MAFYQNIISSGLILFLMFLFSVVALALFLTVLNFQYYVFEKSANEAQTKVVQTESIKTIQKRVKELNDDLSAIKKIQDTKSDIYGILNNINEELFKEVKIYSLEIDNNLKSVNVTGFSASRESLVKIRDLLESGSRYKNVDFPLSNLANPRNINFRFSFIYIP